MDEKNNDKSNSKDNRPAQANPNAENTIKKDTSGQSAKSNEKAENVIKFTEESNSKKINKE